MKFALKIQGESKYRSSLKVDGYSGTVYVFRWDDKRRAYVYSPNNQTEVDDIFQTMTRTTMYVFAPIEMECDGTETFVVAATIKETPVVMETPKASLSAELNEACILRGVIVSEDDSNETAQRLVSAYDKGAKDTLDRLPKAKTKAKEAKPTTTQPAS